MGVAVSDHMEVAVIDIDDALNLLVRLMRNRPANLRPLVAVDRASVMSMMQLSRANGGNEAWRVDVLRDLLLDDSDVSKSLVRQKTERFRY